MNRTLPKGGYLLLLTTFIFAFQTIQAAPQEPDYNDQRIQVYGDICDSSIPCVANSIQSGCAACASTGLHSNPIQNAFDNNANSFWMSNSVTTESGCDQSIINPEVIIDLGSTQSIEAIQLYYWQNFCGCSGDYLTTKIYISNDQFNWGTEVAAFPYSSALETRTYSNYVPVDGQYIRIEFKGCPEAWSKVSLNEVKIFGPETINPPNPTELDCVDAHPDNYLISKDVDPDELLVGVDEPSDYAFGDIIGINAGPEWDCFYGSASNNCGPNPFKNLISHVRSFHLQEKDYQNHNFDGEPGCSDCPGPTTQCTPAQRGNLGPLKVGWNGGIDLYKLRYEQWANDGFENIQASLEAIHLYCENGARAFPQKWWTEEEWGGIEYAYDNARAYGRVFAEELCPNDNDCLIRHLEIGNEPWQYRDPCFYQEILKGVIDGVKEYYESQGNINPDNWPMKLLPGAFQAYRDDIEVVDFNTCNIFEYCPNRYDFVGSRIPKDYIQYLDGLSVHPYAFNTSHYAMNEFPEAPASQSEMPRFKSMIHWMDNNMPGKKLFISEFGWDSKLVGDIAQGIYMLRSTFIFGRHNVYRATMYTTRDNVGSPFSSACYDEGLYNTSGLLTDDSPPAGGVCVPNPNTKKIAFYVMEEMVEELGDKRFMGLVAEDDKAYAYLIGDKDATTPSHIIAWNPVRLNTGTDYNNSDLYNLDEPVTLQMPNELSYTGGNVEWIDGVIDNQYETWRITPGAGTIELPLSGCPILIPLNDVDPVEIETNEEEGICGDGIQNGDEQGVDCGGLDCNLAIGKTAAQSCEQNSGAAARAVDGEINGNYYEAFSVAHTCWQHQPWWQVDLGQVEDIDRIRLFNRTDANADYLKNYYLLLSNNPIPNGSLDELLDNPEIESYFETTLVGSPSTININYQARYIRLQLEGQGFICLAEMEVIKGCNETPQCDPAGTTCDDADPNTSNDVWDGFCNCEGENITQCEPAGVVCDDGDSNTTNDAWDGNCNCIGIPSGCDPADTTCDDGDSNTTNDLWDGNCNCIGTPLTTDCYTNVALNKSTSQSSVNQGGTSDRAVDGNTSGNFYQDYAISLTNWENNAWWEIDLGEVYDIQDIKIYNRTDADMDQLKDFHVFVSDVAFVDTDLYATKIQFEVEDFFETSQGLTPTEIAVNRSGRYVRVQLENSGFLGLAEVEVIACTEVQPAGRVAETSDEVEADGLKAWQTPEKSREITLFPNPTNSILYIDLTKLSGFNAKMDLYMNSGQLIESFNYEPIPNDLVHINILDYPNGTYFLKIHLTSDIVITKQFVIMK